MITFKEFIIEPVNEGLSRTVASIAAGAALFGASAGGVAAADRTPTASTQAVTRASTPLPAIATRKPLLTEIIGHHEGRRNRVYRDSRGYRTIGIGYNLDQRGAKQTLTNMGIPYADVIKGKRILTDKEIDKLFEKNLNQAISDAQKYFPDIDRLPVGAQVVLVDMSFNLGLPKLEKFQKLKGALVERNFTKAAHEMQNSRWYRQVRTRGRRLVTVMRNLAI